MMEKNPAPLNPAPVNTGSGVTPPLGGANPASRPRHRKSVRVVLLAGLALGVGVTAVQIGRGERVGTSEVASAADAPAVGEKPYGLPQPSGVVEVANREPTGVTNASTARNATEHSDVSYASNTTEPQPPTNRARFEIGDKFKIAFYERVDDTEQNKWGRTGSALQGFQQRPELSGEYTVQDDGTIALPLLGSFAAANLVSVDLQAALASSFEKLTGRKGFVTILSLERPPIYVLGPVKNPGAYKYVPGMTVLHTVALAGGFDRRNVEPWQQVEAVREIEKRRTATEIVAKTLARAAVLKSERDGSAVKPPPPLLQLVSKAEARRLITDEAERRAPIVAARHNREHALSASAQAAKQEVQMLSNRLRPIDDLIKLRAIRANAMRSLLQRGTINNLVMVQAQSELSDAQQRRQDAVNQYAMAQQRAALTEQEQAKFQVDTRTEIETEILATEEQIAANERDFATSDGILGVLRVTPVRYTPSSGAAGHTYEIVRQKGATGPVALTANGMTTLQAGDLVRVITGNEEGSADPALQPLQRTPASSAAHADGGPISDGAPGRDLRIEVAR
jgi:protein involved in polysaccharide export with SLBB domain